MNVERAYRKLTEIANADPRDAPCKDNKDEPTWGPVVVFECISSNEFIDWLEATNTLDNKSPRGRWHYEPLTSSTGRVVMYSFASEVHALAAAEVVESIHEQIQVFGDDFQLRRALQSFGDACFCIGDALQSPDQCLRPFAASRASFPTLVVEIAFTNEPLHLLQDKLTLWMGQDTTVQIAIGIKLFADRRRKHAILMQRNGFEQHIDFGDDVVNANSLTFPLRSLFHGVPMPHALEAHANVNLAIDLMALGELIHAKL